MSRSKGNTNHDMLLKIGKLSVEDFSQYYFQDTDAPMNPEKQPEQKSFNPELLYMILDEMCKSKILFLERFMFTGEDPTYRVESGLTLFLFFNNCLDNVIYGYPFMIDKYRLSLFKIVVGGDVDGIGSGFLFKFDRAEKRRGIA